MIAATTIAAAQMTNHSVQVFWGVFLFVVYVLLCGLVGRAAARRGHSDLGWGAISFFLTPIVGGIAVSLLRPTVRAQIAAGVLVRCPRCREAIRPAAVVCRFCGAEFEDEEDEASPHRYRARPFG